MNVMIKRIRYGKLQVEKFKAFKSNINMKEQKYIAVMFPYPSGSGLHCGHWYNYAIMDSYCRYQKFIGNDVFQPFFFGVKVFLVIFALSITQIVSAKEFNNIAPNTDVSYSHELGNRPSVAGASFFVYSHTRIDKKEIFYIGIGTCPFKHNTYKAKYKRAFQKWGRNYHWQNTIKCTNYSIDIIFESNSYDEIKNKEIELIEKNKPSCNITKGGEGTLGFSGTLHPKSKKVYQYNFDGNFIKEWDSINIAGKTLNIFSTRIVACLKGKYISVNNYRWSCKLPTHAKKRWDGL